MNGLKLWGHDIGYWSNFVMRWVLIIGVLAMVLLVVLTTIKTLASSRERGRIVLIVGPQGAGKTTFAARLVSGFSAESPSRRDRKLGSPVKRPVLTNAELRADWTVISSWRELTSSVLARHKVILLDEAHQWLPAGKPLNIGKRVLLTQFRKRRCDLVMTTQDEMTVNKSMRKLCTEVWFVHPVIPGVVHMARLEGQKKTTLQRRFYRPVSSAIDTLAPVWPPTEWDQEGRQGRELDAWMIAAFEADGVSIADMERSAS